MLKKFVSIQSCQNLTFFVLLFVFFVIPHSSMARAGSGLKFEISFPSKAHDKPITGRVYVMISRNDGREPRFQVGMTGVPIWGKNITALKPWEGAVIDETVFGYPLESINEIPHGDYYVQGFVNIYTEFTRSDGHTIWLHNDQWEGQHWNRSPGNIYSDVIKIGLDPSADQTVDLICKNVIPPVKIPPDTKWVKRIKFQSAILTAFWGQPIYLGATILLPRGYDENPDQYYPVNYVQGHFSLRAPGGFRTDDPGREDPRGRRGYAFYKAWTDEVCPRMIYVTFQHPCPYFDDSYAVNSANCGPYGDAIMEELIPRVESKFRVIKKPWARVLEGGSTGGWEAMALQVFHPDFFGGAFIYCPDPVDFSDVEGFNIYEDTNAYWRQNGWVKVPTISVRYPDGTVRLTAKQKNQYELVRGTKGRSGEQFDIWSAVYGPVGEDGYFKPLYDKVTGEIDPEVARYWKENYDLHHILKKNWETLGPKLRGKIHIFTGDMDSFYLNNAVHLLEGFLEKTTNPHYGGFIWYAPRKPHCWSGSFTPAEELKFFAIHIATNAPSDVETLWWNY